MENIVFGILAVLLSFIGYFLAYHYYSHNKYRVTILLIVFSGLILRIFTAADFYLHTWDERYHGLVAKNIVEDPLKPMLYNDPVLPYNYKNWTANHVWVHKQPLPLYTIAASFFLFGVNEITLRLPSILLTTIGIYITFLIGSHLFNRKVGFLAAFLYSIHGLIIEATAGRVATDHIDIFFLFFVELAVLMAIKFAQSKKYIFNILCGIGIGAAILSKWLPALIVLPIWLLLVLDSGKFNFKEIIKQGSILILTTVAVFLPWQIYIYSAFPLEAQYESEYNFRHIFEALDEQAGPFYYHFDKLRIVYGEIIYLPIIWFIWKTIKKIYNYKRMIILIWFLIPFLFFSFIQTKMQGYTLFTAPAIFIIKALFWEYLYFYRNRIKYKWIIYTILFLLIALPIRYSIERIKPFSKLDRNPVWVKQLKNIDLAEHEKNIIFNAKHPIEAMFYTNSTAYTEIPDKDYINKLIDSGYKIILFDYGNLSEELKHMENVEIRSMKN